MVGACCLNPEEVSWNKGMCQDSQNDVNYQIQLSPTLYEAIDIVYGNEHTTNPPAILAPISTTPLLLSSAGNTPSPRTPSPAPLPDDDVSRDTEGSPGTFNTGRKVKQRTNKMDGLLNLLSDNIALKQEDLEEKRKEREARQKELEKIGNTLETLVESQRESAKLMTSILTSLALKD